MSTTDALVQLSFQIQRILAEAGIERDLSIAQLRLLGIVRDRPAGMLHLGGHLGLDRSAMAGLVSGAEERGLVRSLPSPRDSRVVLVESTPRGRRVAQECAREIERQVAELIAGLSATDQELLTALAAEPLP
ncbi:MarR family winged helix-turn-helix transcriptional regulator [Actinoplanes awajinensis]|uniref:HTH marR-type domain-containing protein n=1 Tax=Actinoplanes awajinensis subsp. mycoplanecinus TaxID=135947 RepID=A0A124GA38_9ACTN|nr:hypothetical protein [Actinoplanes awajinensis]KUL30955.1 hypothetical protein ADL15_23695 [Actinoplanes awajinensis subsp. mycoplanecinus]